MIFVNGIITMVDIDSLISVGINALKYRSFIKIPFFFPSFSFGSQTVALYRNKGTVTLLVQ